MRKKEERQSAAHNCVHAQSYRYTKLHKSAGTNTKTLVKSSESIINLNIGCVLSYRTKNSKQGVGLRSSHYNRKKNNLVDPVFCDLTVRIKEMIRLIHSLPQELFGSHSPIIIYSVRSFIKCQISSLRDCIYR